MTVEQYVTGMKRTNLLDTVREILLENEGNIILMNQRQLYDDSENADGFSIPLYNSITYALWKNQRNAGPGMMHPDLYDTGAFYRAFFLEIDKDRFELDSRDTKSGLLKEKYGENIFGLRQDHLLILANEYVIDGIIEKIYAKF